MVNLFQISWKNVWSKPLSAILTLLLLVLGVGFVAFVLPFNRQLEDQFVKNIKGIDMVVGAKGSPLQLILANVYHIDYPTGNIELSALDKLVENKQVKNWIPLAYGDRYENFRIVGTNEKYVEHYGAELESGRLWNSEMEITLGSKTAELTGLNIGDELYGSHGLAGEKDEHKDSPYTVVGVLKPTGSVIDQLLLTSVESVWAVHEKAHHHDHDETDSAHHHHPREITAALITFRNRAMGMIRLPKMVNKMPGLQAALPAVEINRLMGRLGIGFKAAKWLAWLVMLVAGISMFISLYNSLKERKYELALMRSLGASRQKVFWMVMLEGFLLTGIGLVLGFLVARLGLWVASGRMADGYHYQLAIWKLTYSELYVAIGVMFLTFLAALLPSVEAWKTNISRTLAEG